VNDPGSATLQRSATAVGACLLLFGCLSEQVAKVSPEQPKTVVAGRRFPVPDAGNPGLSGADSGGDGIVWLVPERRRVLLSLRDNGGGELALAEAPLPVEGVPPGLDTESLALLEDGRFVFGTEAQRTRDKDTLLFAERRGERVVVVDTIELDYDGWGQRAPRNKGIEGLCAAGGKLLAGVEWVLEEGDRRRAPIAVYDLTERSWSYHRLALSSSTGKLASLWCVAETERIAAWAIERHYGVVRILRFDLPLVGAARDLTPSRVLVLEDERDSLNFEGIFRGSDGVLTLVSDNQLGVAIHGPAMAWRSGE